jgi:hypothetical protein
MIKQRVYMSPYPQNDITYLGSYPKNPYQHCRIWLARHLIRWGRRLLLNNTWERHTTTTS